MEITIEHFTNLRESVSPSNPVKVVILDNMFAGEFSSVYDKVKDLQLRTGFSDSTMLTYTPLNIDILRYVIAWTDRLPGIIIALEKSYPIKTTPLWSRIEELITLTRYQLESKAVLIEQYLDGLIEQPDISEVGTNISNLELLTQPELLDSQWYDVVRSGNVPLAQLLIWNGFNVSTDKYGIEIAITSDKLEMLKMLLDTDINLLEYLNSYVVCGAVVKGYLNIIKLLIEYGMNVDCHGYDDKSILSHAVENDRLDFVEFLLEKGADVNFVDTRGEGPLHIACREGRYQIAKLLVESGAKINTKNKYIRTPIYFASENGFTNIVELLLDKGADIHVVDRYGRTALSAATSRGRNEIVHLLEMHDLYGL